MKRTLLAIAADLAALDELTDELGVDADAARETAERWFAGLDDELRDKLDSYCGLLREIELRMAARRAEADRLKARIGADERKHQWLMAMLKTALESRAIKRVETGRFTVTVRQNGGERPLVTPPVDELPPGLTRVVTTRQVNQEKIRALLSEGELIDGCYLAPRGTHVRIK